MLLILILLLLLQLLLWHNHQPPQLASCLNYAMLCTLQALYSPHRAFLAAVNNMYVTLADVGSAVYKPGAAGCQALEAPQEEGGCMELAA